MSFINEFREWINEIEQLEKNKKYEPDWHTIEQIETNPVDEMVLVRLFNNYQTNQQIYVEPLFENLTKITIQNAKLMTEKTKREVRNRIQKRLEMVPVTSEHLTLLFSSFVQPIEERMRVLTIGKDPLDYIWLTKEECREIQQKLSELMLLSMDLLLGLQEDIRYDQAVLILDVLFIGKLLNIVKLKRQRLFEMVGDEDQKKLIEKVKTWYNETNQTFVVAMLESSASVPITRVSPYMYLLQGEQKKRVIAYFMGQIEKEFRALQEIKEKDVRGKACFLQIKIDKILKWEEGADYE